MSDSAQKGRTSKPKSLKFAILQPEDANYELDRLAGDVGTSKAYNRKQKVFEQQQIYNNEAENEQSEESNSFQILMNWIQQERIL